MKHRRLLTALLLALIAAVAFRVVVDHAAAEQVTQRGAVLLALQAQVYTMPAAVRAEYEQSQKAVGLDANYEYAVLADFHGRYFSYTDGVRGTSWQPARYTLTVYMFGSSTLAAQNTPDDDTIPSQLQRRLAAAGIAYRVVNEGQPGLSAVQEFERLKLVGLRPGDVALFYDGGQDAAEPDRYRGWLSQARQYAMSHGATFYAVLQPQIFSRPLSGFEQEIIDNLPADYAVTAGNIRVNWPRMQAANRALGGLDLTHGLDELRDSQAVYLDMLHIAPRGNAVIAQAIYAYLTTF